MIIDYLKKIEDAYFKKTHLVISGEIGVGKSYWINKFIDINNKTPIYIDNTGSEPFPMYPIIIALNNYLIDQNLSHIAFNFDESSSSDMNQNIFYTIKRILSTKELILVFNHITLQSTEIYNFINMLIERNQHPNLFIIIEYDTNDNVHSNTQLHEQIFSLINIEFLSINILETNEMKLKMIELYNEIDSSEESLNYILRSVSGNVRKLIMCINYLKNEKKARTIDGILHIDEIPQNHLYNFLKIHIEKKYNNLNKKEKELIQNSSIFGITFKSDDLAGIFNYLYIDDLLTKIGNINKLVNKSGDKIYKFETQEIFDYIHNISILRDNIDSIYNNIYTYYLKKLTSHMKNFDVLNYLNYLESARKFSYIIKDDNYLILSIEMISICFSLNDFKQVTNIAYQLYNQKLNIIDKDKKLIIYNFWINSLYKLGNYIKIGEIINEFNKNSCNKDELNYFLYIKSLYLTITDKSAESIETLNKIHIKTDTWYSKFLQAKTYQAYASTYDFICLPDKASYYYNKALGIFKSTDFKDEYYKLLKQSSMVNDLVISSNYLKEALDYFRKTNNKVEIGKTLLNMSVDNMYLSKKQVDTIPLALESEEIFMDFGSDDVAIVYNILGIFDIIYENDYQNGINHFILGLKYANTSWIKNTLNNNLANSYRMINKYDLFLTTIKSIEKSIDTDQPLIEIYYDMSMALYYESINKLDAAVFHFDKVVKNEKSEYRHYTLAKLHLNEISDTFRNISEDSSIYRFIYDCYKNNHFWGTIRFWEE